MLDSAANGETPLLNPQEVGADGELGDRPADYLEVT